MTDTCDKSFSFTYPLDFDASCVTVAPPHSDRGLRYPSEVVISQLIKKGYGLEKAQWKLMWNVDAYPEWHEDLHAQLSW